MSWYVNKVVFSLSLFATLFASAETETCNPVVVRRFATTSER